MLDKVFKKTWWPMLLNFLWIFHVFKGGVVLGFWPACYALLETNRMQEADQDDVRLVYATFKKHYRGLFWKFNQLGLVFGLILGLLLWDLYLALQIEHLVGLLSSFCLIAAIVQGLIVGAHLIVNGGYLKQMGIRKALKHSVARSFSNIKGHAYLIVSLFGSTLVATWLPGLLLFYGASVPLLLIGTFIKSNFGGSSCECLDCVA